MEWTPCVVPASMITLARLGRFTLWIGMTASLSFGAVMPVEKSNQFSCGFNQTVTLSGPLVNLNRTRYKAFWMVGVVVSAVVIDPPTFRSIPQYAAPGGLPR